MTDQIAFSKNVYQIEEELHYLLAKLPLFQAKNPLFLKIFGFFTTRQYLTQEDIRELTGLSAGKISQELNELVNQGLIEVLKVSETGKITYNAGSAGKMFINLTISIIEGMAKWQDRIGKLKLDFDKNKENLKNLKGFEKMESIFNIFIPMLALYTDILDQFKEAVKELESQ